ncbi:ADP-glucose pyrophosphorylase [Streptococcus suis]|nr:ADP-glucose pyrophosphorylase [Streptococcus suis]
MAQNKMLAMILAGGRGTRLEGLTKKSPNQRSHLAESTALLTFLSVTVPTQVLILSEF